MFWKKSGTLNYPGYKISRTSTVCSFLPKKINMRGFCFFHFWPANFWSSKTCVCSFGFPVEPVTFVPETLERRASKRASMLEPDRTKSLQKCADCGSCFMVSNKTHTIHVSYIFPQSAKSRQINIPAPADFCREKRWKLEGHLSHEKPFLGKENGGNVGMGGPLIINHHFPYSVEILEEMSFILLNDKEVVRPIPACSTCIGKGKDCSLEKTWDNHATLCW